MKKFKVFEVVLDDAVSPIKMYVPAESKKDAESYVQGNGEILCTKESSLIQDIALDFLADTLENNGYGKAEIDIITRTLQRVGLERPL